MSQAGYQTQYFRSGQQGVLWGQISAFFWHAIHAAQVALLSEGYPKVCMPPPGKHIALQCLHMPCASDSDVVILGT